MTTEVEKRKKRSYTEAEIQRGLTELAACSGNSRLAARHLALDNFHIDHKVLWTWANRNHVDTYERIRRETLPAIQAQAAEEHMALARQQMELTAQASALVASRMPQMEDKDLVNAMGKADIGSGIHTEKAQLLSGQPTQRHARSSEEIIREMQSLGMEVIDVDVVSEEIVSESVAVPASVPTRSSQAVTRKRA